MSDDKTAIEASDQPVSIPYLVFAIGVGVFVAGMIAVAGANRWPLVPTLLIGATAQTGFRIAKQTWSNALARGHVSEDDDNRLLSVGFMKTLALIYVAMIAISTLWYGVGWGGNWLWRTIF